MKAANLRKSPIEQFCHWNYNKDQTRINGTTTDVPSLTKCLYDSEKPSPGGSLLLHHEAARETAWRPTSYNKCWPAAKKTPQLLSKKTLLARGPAPLRFRPRPQRKHMQVHGRIRFRPCASIRSLVDRVFRGVVSPNQNLFCNAMET